jgi:amidophosphoribosyltransferase
VKEACGVFGVLAPGAPVAQLTFDGLFALQHRGQESAGMAVSDGETIIVVKDMGLVMSVFDERTLAPLQGDLALGHVRYSTTGQSTWHNAQPVYRSVDQETFALGHNGNLTNTDQLTDDAGMLPGIITSDSDLVAELLARYLDAHPADTEPGGESGASAMGGAAAGGGGAAGSGGGGGEVHHDRRFLAALRSVLPMLEGAFSLGLIDATRLVAVRDPHGFRPLCLGRLDYEVNGEARVGWAIASESPALDVVGAQLVREIEPGEMVVIGEDGPQSFRPFEAASVDPRLCVFEYVYFARPDSRLKGREVYSARRRMGELLALEVPVAADLVIGVPDSGVVAAEGYAAASGIQFGQGLVKNRYIGRTFIAPTPEARALGVRRKLNPLRASIEGKRLVVVDDSIVRGTTTRQLVKMLREAGAAEVHLRISSPPFQWPCFYGIDTPVRSELIASRLSVEGVREHIGADSLGYLSLDHLMEAVGAPPNGDGFCRACLTGSYPTEVPLFVEGTRAGDADQGAGDSEAVDPVVVGAAGEAESDAEAALALVNLV